MSVLGEHIFILIQPIKLLEIHKLGKKFEVLEKNVYLMQHCEYIHFPLYANFI